MKQIPETLERGDILFGRTEEGDSIIVQEFAHDSMYLAATEDGCDIRGIVLNKAEVEEVAAALNEWLERRKTDEQRQLDEDFRQHTMSVPEWATSAVASKTSDDRWTVTVTGDAYGTGKVKPTTSVGDTPRKAMNQATDYAEGWTRFDLTPKEDE